MDGILPGKKFHKIEPLEELKVEAYDVDGGLVMFPVRHHSPICAYHLKKTIEEYRPDAILVEGPESANHIISGLTEEDSKPPLSIYYTHTRGIKKEDKEKYMCYYPMLKYSPEYFALKYARENNIHSEFIDLAFHEIIDSTEKGKGFREIMKKQEYGDDRYLHRREFLTTVYRKLGVRNYHEFWEKHFEMRGVSMDSKDFVYEMLKYCYLMRTYHSDEELFADGCIAREKYMASKVNEALEKFKKVLVVTGGFHTYGILKYMKDVPVEKKKKKPKENSEAYLIPYSYKHSDSANGYKSGMPYPYFYGRIWDGISDGKKENTYYETAKYFLSKCNRTLRTMGEGTSTDDSIQALVMARGLSEIREKRFIGSQEIFESVRSCFVKGEINEVNCTPLSVLNDIMVGENIGEISSKVDIPPIIKDFKEKCRTYRIKLVSMTKEEKILEIFTKKYHGEVSRFFHRITFLIPEFGRLIRGNNMINGDGKALKREIWEYAWSPNVEKELIEKSLYGGSIVEAAEELLYTKSLEITDSSGEFSLLILTGAKMGLERAINSLLIKLKEMIFNDRNFLSICDCIRRLMYVGKLKLRRSEAEYVDDCIRMSYERAICLIECEVDISSLDEKVYIDGLMLLNHIARKNHGYEDILIEKFEEILNMHKINPVLEGVILGILYSWNRVGYEYILKRVRGYLEGSGEEKKKSAKFLKGLFQSARDIFLRNNEMIKVLDEFVSTLDSDTFLEILPELRYAFTSFMPREIDQIGKSVSNIYDTLSGDILLKRGVSELEVNSGIKRDDKAKKILEGWGVISG